jgi:vacuolar-type H+-ATPase subunit H
MGLLSSGLISSALLSAFHPRPKDDKGEPWEYVPPWVPANPIGLFKHIWATDDSKIAGHQFLSILAYLIIFCMKNPEQEWLPSVISVGLQLASLEVDIQTSIGEELFLKAKGKARYAKNLRQFSDSMRNLNAEKIAARKAEIHSEASHYIGRGKPKAQVISLIARNNKMNERTVRRDLQDHPTGLWKPRPKKK